MFFQQLPLDGAFLISPDRHIDERGYFARTFCREEFLSRGLKDCSLQCSTSFNLRRGTLRGLHFQRGENAETKLVRCVRGAVFDVIVDVRPGFGNFGKWHAETLTAENGLSLYIPAGFAHGFITLVDETELGYQMADPFVANASAGIVWSDPDLAISWPVEPAILSERDRTLQTFAAFRDRR